MDVILVRCHIMPRMIICLISALLFTLCGCRTVSEQPVSLKQAIHENCLPVSRYPKTVRAVMKLPPGYSGVQTLGGTSREYCSLTPVCGIYSKAEFEALWGEAVTNYTNQAIFALKPCYLDADYLSLLAAAEERAWKETLTIDRRFDAQRIMEVKSGKWCGRENKKSNFAPSEVAISFQRRRDRMVGVATTAWGKRPEEPVGEEGYFDYQLLVPKWADTEVLVFEEVSRHHSGAIWTLNLKDMILTDSQYRKYALSRSCEGYWDKAGEFPF